MVLQSHDCPCADEGGELLNQSQGTTKAVVFVLIYRSYFLTSRVLFQIFFNYSLLEPVGKREKKIPTAGKSAMSASVRKIALSFDWQSLDFKTSERDTTDVLLHIVTLGPVKSVQLLEVSDASHDLNAS